MDSKRVLARVGPHVFVNKDENLWMNRARRVSIQVAGWTAPRSGFLAQRAVVMQVTLSCIDCGNCRARLRLVQDLLVSRPDAKLFYIYGSHFLLIPLPKNAVETEATQCLSDFLGAPVVLGAAKPLAPHVKKSPMTKEERLKRRRERSRQKLRELYIQAKMWWANIIPSLHFDVLCVSERNHDTGGSVYHLPITGSANIEHVKRSENLSLHRVIHFNGNTYPIVYVRPGLNRNCVVFAFLTAHGPELPIWEVYADIPTNPWVTVSELKDMVRREQEGKPRYR